MTLLNVIAEEEIWEDLPGPQKKMRNTDGADFQCEDDISSLEESVEEHKQPQTEEIMNAELVARVVIIFSPLHLRWCEANLFIN